MVITRGSIDSTLERETVAKMPAVEEAAYRERAYLFGVSATARPRRKRSDDDDDEDEERLASEAG